MVRPSALAALRLMTSLNFVGRSTGRSVGFASPRPLAAAPPTPQRVLPVTRRLA